MTVEAPVPIGRVAQLWRYPVKSLRGESVESLRFGVRGAEGDRRWAVRGQDGKLGSGKSTRRFRRMPGLLSLRAGAGADGSTWIELPTGERVAVDDPSAASRVGAIVGEEVALVADEEHPHVDDAPVHLVTSTSLDWIARRRPSERIDSRRFRPNLVVDTPAGGGPRPEDDWVGKLLVAGDARLRVVGRTERCVMVTLRQEDLGFAPSILRELESQADACLGVYAEVVEEGDVRVGDEVGTARA